MLLSPVVRRRAAEATFRLLFSLIFVVAGATHLLRPEAVAGRLERAPMGFLATAWASPEALVILAGIALLAGGLALLLGFRVRAAALLLMLVLLPITLTVQVGAAELGPLFKNVALLGGLVHFAAAGAGAWSLDAAWRRRPKAPPATLAGPPSF